MILSKNCYPFTHWTGQVVDLEKLQNTREHAKLVNDNSLKFHGLTFGHRIFELVASSQHHSDACSKDEQSQVLHHVDIVASASSSK